MDPLEEEEEGTISSGEPLASPISTHLDIERTISSQLSTPSQTPRPTAEGALPETPYSDWPTSLRQAPSSHSVLSGNGSLNFSSLDAPVEQHTFDEEFQRLTSEISDERILKEESSFRSLSRLSRDFRFAATTYGKVIIAEKHLPFEHKTIKPVELPGWAGGEKYLAGGILFRFAVDNNKLYGSDELAGKEAAHQLRGLTELVRAGVEGLHFPLMALIDYRGYRLLAVSRLPINRGQTLVLGSQDAGETILEGTEEARLRMAALAKTLNLKRHRIADKHGGIHHLYGPCDFEIHEGPENRLYAVDFARLFPPEPPRLFLHQAQDEFGRTPRRQNSSETERSYSVCGTGEDDDDTSSRCLAPHLVKLLRPELVRTFPKPLSPDAFSRFGDLDRAENDADVEAAGQWLINTCIPNAAKALNEIEPMETTKLAREIRRWGVGIQEEDVAVGLSGGEYSSQSRDWLSSMTANGKTIARILHKHGVNIRHLGRVHAMCSRKWQGQILGEAVSRVVKAKVRAAMRHTMPKVRTAVLTPFLETVTEQLNTMLGAPVCSRPSSRSCTCEAACICLCECPRSVSPTTSVDSSQGIHQQLQVHYDDTSEEKFRRRSRWWCHTLPQMLEDRFGFKPHRELLGLNAKRTAHSAARCHCCGCGFARYISRPVIFCRVSEACGMVLAPPLCSGLLHSLEGNSRPINGVKSPATPTSPPPGSTTSPGPRGSPQQGLVEPCLFDFVEPFEEGAIVDVLGSIQALPWLDYVTGTALLIKAKNLKNAGAFNEAKRLARTARESFEAGLAQSPTDPRLLCNLAFLLEDVLDRNGEALRLYEESVLKNPMHARSHYYLALALWRKHDKQPRSSRDPNLARAVQEHFSRAVDCSPTNANILKDFGRFKRAIQKDDEGALKLFVRALEVEPTHVRAHENLGTLYEQKGEIEKASEVWGKLTTIECNFTESIQARLYLARCMLKMSDKVDEARKLAVEVSDEILKYKQVNRGHSDRPSAAWAVKCSRLLIEIAKQIAAKEGTCSSTVHDIFDTPPLVFGWFSQTIAQAQQDGKKGDRAWKEADELSRAHADALLAYSEHVLYCDCSNIDRMGLSEELRGRAYAVHPTQATAWRNTRLQNEAEGIFETQVAVVVPNGSIGRALPTDGKTSDASSSTLGTRPSFNQVVKTGLASATVSSMSVTKATSANSALRIGKRKEQPYELRSRPQPAAQPPITSSVSASVPVVSSSTKSDASATPDRTATMSPASTSAPSQKPASKTGKATRWM